MKFMAGILAVWLLLPVAVFAADVDGDKIADADDYCPLRAEVYNGLADDDGCPDSLGIVVEIVLQDERGKVQAGVVEVLSDQGIQKIEGRSPLRFVTAGSGFLQFNISARGFVPTTMSMFVGQGEEIQATVRLQAQ